MTTPPFDLEHFERKIFPEKEQLFSTLASEGQSPRALIVGCSDSRVIPELITGSEPGDLFVSRNAGNIVPPYGGPANAVSSAIEYAVAALGVPNIIVCGHSGCGAMAAFDTPDALEALPQVRDWIQHSLAAEAVVRCHPDLSDDDRLNMRVEQNVRVQLSHLRTHPSVAAALEKGELTLHGWVFDIATGGVRILDQETDSFVAHTRQESAQSLDGSHQNAGA